MESSADRCKRGVEFESFDVNNGGAQSVTSSVTEYKESNTGSSRSSSDTFSDEAKAKESSSPTPLDWPIRKAQMLKSSISDVSGGERKTHLDESNLKKLGSKDSVTDVAGEVVEVGPLLKNFNVGDKVVAYISGGGLAEYAVAKSSLTVKRPPEVSAAKAVGLPVAGLTAHQMLTGPAGIKLDRGAPQSNILITAASGGVGIYAVQLAKLGNTHVTALVGPGTRSLLKA